MSLPEVSIIVPIYNSEKYLSRCIDSIVSQTFDNFECILINDGSTDNSPFICDRYSQSDDRLIVIHQKNSGLSVTRNRGMEIARAKYVCHVDSDDYIQNNMCEILVDAANRSDADVVCCGYIENTKVRSLCDKDFIFRNRDIIKIVHYLEMRQAFGNAWNKIYKKSILDTYSIRLPLATDKFGEDMIFNLQYFKHIKTAYVSSNCLYHYSHDNKSSLAKENVTLAECDFRFENVSNLFMQIDNNAKSVFYAELLAKDFKYTVALLLRLYSEKKRIKERQEVINRLKKFYKKNGAKNKFGSTIMTSVYKMLLYTPLWFFDTAFSFTFFTITAFLKIRKRKSRFINK